MKKRNLRTCFLLLLFALCVGCTTSEKTPADVTKIDLSSVLEQPSKKNVFKNVRFIQLENNGDNLLGEDLYFELSDGKIYIFDRKDQKAVFIFDEDGKYLGKTGQAGKGPGEYVNAVDFLVRNDIVNFLVHEETDASIFQYTSSGGFLGKIKLNYLPYSFELTPENLYAVSMNYNKMEHDHQVYLLDESGAEVNKFLSNNTEINLPIGENCFGKSEDEVFYFEPFNDTVYTFVDSSLLPLLKLDFGGYAVPEKFFETDIMKGFQLINEQGFALIKSVFANDEHMIFEIVRQKDGMSTVFLVSYNRQNGETKYVSSADDDVIFRYPVGLNDKNEMMFLVFPFGNIDKNAKEYGIELQAKNLNEDDNALLLYCKL